MIIDRVLRFPTITLEWRDRRNYNAYNEPIPVYQGDNHHVPQALVQVHRHRRHRLRIHCGCRHRRQEGLEVPQERRVIPLVPELNRL